MALTTDRRAKALARKQQKQKQKALAPAKAKAAPAQRVTPEAVTTSESTLTADEPQSRPRAATAVAAKQPAAAVKQPATAVADEQETARMRSQSVLEESGLSALEADAMLWDAAERGDCEAVQQCCAMLPSEHLNMLQCGSAPLHEATSNGRNTGHWTLDSLCCCFNTVDCTLTTFSSTAAASVLLPLCCSACPQPSVPLLLLSAPRANSCPLSAYANLRLRESRAYVLLLPSAVTYILARTLGFSAHRGRLVHLLHHLQATLHLRAML